MCGINVVIAATSGRRGLLDRMAQATIHRGPDHTGYFSQHLPGGQWLFVAAHRLGTTAPHRAEANQPLLSPSGRWLLLFNGQVYNYRELAATFLPGSQPASDTEVLLALAEAGLLQGDTPPPMSGMWAIVLVDLFSGELYYWVDELNQKPLYASLLPNNEIMVCSEARGLTAALAAHSKCMIAELDWDPNPAALRDYLVLKGSARPINTAYQRLEGRGILSFKNRVRKLPAPSLPYEGPTGKFQLSWLAQAMHTERRHALLFSAGIDSTVLALAAREAALSLPAFYVGEKETPALVTRVAKSTGLELRPVQVSVEQFVQDWPQWLIGMDAPVPDMAGYLTHKVAELCAAEDIRVLYSGAGADELFAGYNRHRAWGWLFQLQRLGLHQAVARVLPRVARSGQLLALAEALGHQPQQAAMTWLRMTAVPGLKDQLPASAKTVDFDWTYALDHDLVHYLPHDVLLMSDNASMRHGVEVRLPFLQREVVGWARQNRQTSWLTQGKPVLKQILRAHALLAVAQQPKTGFGINLPGWLAHPACTPLFAFTSERAKAGKGLFAFIEPELYWRLLDQWQRGRREYSQAVFGFLVLDQWLHYQRQG